MGGGWYFLLAAAFTPLLLVLLLAGMLANTELSCELTSSGLYDLITSN